MCGVVCVCVCVSSTCVCHMCVYSGLYMITCTCQVGTSPVRGPLHETVCVRERREREAEETLRERERESENDIQRVDAK